MYNILTFNKISHQGLSRFPPNLYNLSENNENPDAILLRSYNLHEYRFQEGCLAVARAGAGTNNIPVDVCSEKGIVVFNTPGANANAVKELVIAGLLLSSRKIIESINWTNTLKSNPHVQELAEKEKANFQGPELKGKKIGVVGLGAIGVLVANAAKSLGMEVLGYDPYMSVDAAWGLSRSVLKAVSIRDIIGECDYVTLHMPLNENTKYMFNKNILMSMKMGVKLINFSRSELVETEGLKSAIEAGIISKYVTDFPEKDILDLDNVIATPHIGASTPESEDNCAVMAVDEIRDYLEYGNIRNSVNLPNCELPYVGKERIVIINKNIPNMIRSVTTVLSENGVNIDNMINKSKGNMAVTLIDIDGSIKNKSFIEKLNSIEGIILVRTL